MNCCIKCFKDPEIKDIISGVNKKGDCNFCESKSVYICEATNDNLKESFERLIDIYCPISDISEEFPREQSDLIKNILCHKWNVFNLSPEKVYLFLKALFFEKYKEDSRLFEEPVLIKGSLQEDYLNKYSILGSSKWIDFVNEIKFTNRFHTNTVNKENFKKVIEASIKGYEAGTVFYRARIWTDGNGFSSKDMGAPPPKNALAGRANPQGISCLYLAESLDTTLHEARAGVYDFATVGKFVLKEKIEVVDLTEIDKISPFLMPDIDLLAANLEHLRKIGDEISRPLRKHDSNLDYLPTQYLSDYIKSIGYAGIKYKSTMCKAGINFAIFDENILECIEVSDYDISSLQYKYDPI